MTAALIPLIIPGAREPRASRPRATGVMGGAGNGSDNTEGASRMDGSTITERRKEGGGGASQRPAPSASPGADSLARGESL